MIIALPHDDHWPHSSSASPQTRYHHSSSSSASVAAEAIANLIVPIAAVFIIIIAFVIMIIAGKDANIMILVICIHTFMNRTNVLTMVTTEYQTIVASCILILLSVDRMIKSSWSTVPSVP